MSFSEGDFTALSRISWRYSRSTFPTTVYRSSRSISEAHWHETGMLLLGSWCLEGLVSEESYHRGQRLSGRLSGSLEIACFPERGRYPGCWRAPLLWTSPLAHARMSGCLMVLLTEGLHTYRYIPDYFLSGTRRVQKCVMLGPNKWAKQFEKKKKKKVLQFIVFSSAFLSVFFVGWHYCRSHPNSKPQGFLDFFIFFFITTSGSAKACHSNYTVPLFSLFWLLHLVWATSVASCVSCFFPLPRLAHCYRAILLSSNPPLLQLKQNLKNLKSSPPLRKHSPHCLAGYSRSPATWYQLTSVSTYLSKFISHHTCGPFGDGTCIPVDGITLPDGSP